MYVKSDPGTKGYESRDMPIHAQLPVLWHDTIDAALATLGFRPTQWAHALGPLLTVGDTKASKKLQRALMDRFAIADVGEVRRILRMAMTSNYGKGTLTIGQKDYALNTLVRSGINWTPNPFPRRAKGRNCPRLSQASCYSWGSWASNPLARYP